MKKADVDDMYFSGLTVRQLAAHLPDVSEVLRAATAHAVSLICWYPAPRWGRDTTWDTDGTTTIVKHRNGCGDAATLLVNPAGAVLVLFNHESDRSPWAFDPIRLADGLAGGVPDELRDLLTHPSVRPDSAEVCTRPPVPEATAVLWRLSDDTCWHFDDVVADLPSHLSGSDQAGWLFIEDQAAFHWDRPERADALRQLYAGDPLTHELAARCAKSGRDLDEALDEAHAAGWPVDRQAMAPTFGSERVYLRVDIQAGGAISGGIHSLGGAIEDAGYYGEKPWGRLYVIDVDNRVHECVVRQVAGTEQVDEDGRVTRTYVVALADGTALDRFVTVDSPS